MLRILLFSFQQSFSHIMSPMLNFILLHHWNIMSHILEGASTPMRHDATTSDQNEMHCFILSTSAPTWCGSALTWNPTWSEYTDNVLTSASSTYFIERKTKEQLVPCLKSLL